MNAKKIIASALLAATATFAMAQNNPAPTPGMGPMFGRDMENLAVGTVLTHEVKVLTGKALFTDRLIPVFAADGKEFELRLPLAAFSGVNLKQGDSLEIQGIFTSLKTPDGKTVYSVRPQIVKVGGKEINLTEWAKGMHQRGLDRRDRRGGNDGPGPGMGPMDGNPRRFQ